MKHTIVFSSLLMQVMPVMFAQADEALGVKIQGSCNAMNERIIAGDYDQGVKFIYPRLVELAGGRQKMTSFLEQGASSIRTLGATMRCSVPTQFSQVGVRHFAIVPVLTSADVVNKDSQKGEFRQWSSALAISEDNQRTWRFITVTERGVSKELLPEGIGALVIPPRDSGSFNPH